MVERADTLFLYLFSNPRSKVFESFNSPRIFTERQIYACFTTVVDVYSLISTMVEKNQWRKFYLNTIGYFYMLNDEYIEWCCRSIKKSLDEVECRQYLSVLPIFLSNIPCHQLNISKESFENNIFKSEVLTRIGILALDVDGSWSLCVPRVSIIIDFLLKGRKDLTSVLKKRRTKLILRDHLLDFMTKTESNGALKTWQLGFNYHLADAIGVNILEIIEEANDPLLKFNV